MSNLTSRPYDPFDLQSMIALCHSLRQQGQVIYPIAADLHEELADPAVQATARLWIDDQQRLAGFAYVSRYQNLVDAFDAARFSPEIEKELVAWAVAAQQKRELASGEAGTLDASSLETDLPRIAFLERHGFERLMDSSLLLARALDEHIPEPRLPDGFMIRPLSGEAKLDAYVALHRTAFGSENMTIAYRQAIMHAPDYIPELDLVAVAPGGELAALCVCQIFPDDTARAGGLKEGWTDPVSTHPAYRRQGLAQALILTGMHLFRERGIDTALLGTSSENAAMLALAGSLGFHTASNTLWYSKKIA